MSDILTLLKMVSSNPDDARDICGCTFSVGIMAYSLSSPVNHSDTNQSGESVSSEEGR